MFARDEDEPASSSRSNSIRCLPQTGQQTSPMKESNEDHALTTLRSTVLIALVANTSLVAVGVLFYFRRSDKHHFQETYITDVDKVQQTIAQRLIDMLRTVDGLTTELVFDAKDDNMTWPFVAKSHYDVLASKALQQVVSLYFQLLVYVAPDERKAWEAYSTQNDGWVDEGLKRQRLDANFRGSTRESYETIDQLWSYSLDYGIVPNNTYGYLPTWQCYPVFDFHPPYNFDHFDVLDNTTVIASFEEQVSILSTPYLLPNPDVSAEVKIAEAYAPWFGTYLGPGESWMEPVSELHYPIAEENSNNTLGQLLVSFYWRHVFQDILMPGKNGYVVVVSNPCASSFTYRIDGEEATFIGRGDHHDPDFDRMRVESKLHEIEVFKIFEKAFSGAPFSHNHCPFSLAAYPSEELAKSFMSSCPWYFAMIAAAVVFFSSCLFLLYDFMVQRRQRRTKAAHDRSQAIVSSIFPTNVHDRLFHQTTADNELIRLGMHGSKENIRQFLNIHGETDAAVSLLTSDASSDGQLALYKTQPVADLFLHTTVMFADLVGFTAWSSARHPSQVFTLLETLYNEFDAMANRHGVFKVETVGDCYVAVCGLPDPRNDHATVMARFARACLNRQLVLVKLLEQITGPDTGDLTMRIGLHSGQVTAGVLRGERRRFQLFGQTVVSSIKRSCQGNCAEPVAHRVIVNKCSRLETTSIGSRIQISQETQQLLAADGKASWTRKRTEPVHAKGLGTLQTYWLVCTDDGANEAEFQQGPDLALLDKEKEPRLVNWIVDVLWAQLNVIQAHRGSPKRLALIADLNDLPRKESATVLDEVVETIQLPQYTDSTQPPATTASLELSVKEQLLEFVTSIARLYQENPFHNFEHATHVIMSVTKLLGRIVSPDLSTTKRDAWRLLHDHTYGITSDPLTQFACSFSALIHDVDHSGVPNQRVIVEDPALASKYGKRSVAEQKSVDLSWSLLQEERFVDLRKAIYGDDVSTQARFRQLVVNCVMATDIMDKDLKMLRNNRWELAFDDAKEMDVNGKDSVDRKATIVLEHLLQASDVSHTMQHWHVYRKWNERLFEELFLAYTAGRADRNPAEFWYEGEMAFFDYYIIPLSQKLRDCGVFGVSSDEYLNYAKQNRVEWEEKGESVVRQMVEKLGVIADSVQL